MKYGDRFHPAEKERERHAETESPHDALDHDEFRLFAAIVKTEETEKEGSEQRIQSVSLEVLKSRLPHRRVARKESCQEIAMEKGNPGQHETESEGRGDAVFQGQERPVHPPGPIILGHESRHGLKEGERHQHDETAELFADANSCRRIHPETVHQAHDP